MTTALKAELRSMRNSRAVMLAALIPAVIAGLVVLVDHQTKLTGLLQVETVVLSLGMLIAGAANTSTARSNGRCWAPRVAAPPAPPSSSPRRY